MSTYRVYQWVKLQQRNRQKKQRKQSAKRKQFLWAALACTSLILAAAMLVGGYQLSTVLQNSPDISVIPALFNENSGAFYHPTRLYDRTNSVLIYEHIDNQADRKYLSVDVGSANSVSPYLIQSIITLNEPDFWESDQLKFDNIFSSEAQTIAECLIERFVLSENTVAYNVPFFCAHWGRN